MIENNDIKLEKNNKAFKFRVAGIIEKDNKILVAKADCSRFPCFPGGHVSFLEDTKTALQRELDEELYFKVKVEDLFLIHENFFKNDNKNFHELCFYYIAKPLEDVETVDKDYEEIDHGFLIKYHYKWIEKNKLLDYNLHPKFVIKKLLKNDKENIHFVSSDY